MKALFCTDGSKISFNAIHNFSKWVKNSDTDAICVVDWTFLPEDIDIENSEFNQSCSNLADDILEHSRLELQKSGLVIGRTLKMCGRVTDVILDELKKSDYDAVLLGSHGKKGLQKWLGSVSFDVLNNSPVSIYISKERNSAKNLLLAISDKENSAEHFRRALKKMDLDEKEIHIIIVNDNPNLLFLEGTLDANWYMKIENEQKKYALNIVKSLEEIVCELGCNVYKTTIITGNPSDEIIKYVGKNDIDLVVVDSRNTENKSKMFSNQTGKRIADNVNCDILILK